MRKKKFYRGIMLFLVVSSGFFFMLGCMGGGSDMRHSPAVPDTSSMDAAQKKQYDDLTKQKKELEAKKASHESKYKDYNEQMQTTTPGDFVASVFTAGKSNDMKHMQLSQKMTSEQLRIDETRAEIKQVEREMDRILDESKRSCFPKGTKIVMADGSYKAIDQIAVEDQVMTYDIGKEELTSSRTNAVYVSENNHLYIINDTLKATAYERFLTKDGWKKMRDIELGDSLFDGEKFISVNSKNKIKEDLVVYNLNIDTSHNFFVFNENIGTSLVHNSGGGSGGGGGK